MLSGLLDRNKTFRPKHKFLRGVGGSSSSSSSSGGGAGGKASDFHGTAPDTLGSGDLSKAVQLPPGENLNEWLAINTVDFYNTTNLLYGAISEFCTSHVCPVMSAGEKFEYLWMDGKQYKRPTKLSAPDYISCLMDWIAALINNDEIFPADPTKFTRQFLPSVKNIFKRMFRVYAHLYYSHYQDMKDLGIERHLNTAFKHLMLFVFEFDLIDKKELVPLRSTITALTSHPL